MIADRTTAATQSIAPLQPLLPREERTAAPGSLLGRAPGDVDRVMAAVSWLRRTSAVPYWLLITLAIGTGGTVGLLGMATSAARRTVVVAPVARTVPLPRQTTLPAPLPADGGNDAQTGLVQSLSAQVGSLAADLEQAQRDADALNNQAQQQSQAMGQTQAALQSSQQQVQATQQQAQAAQLQVQDVQTRVQSLDQRVAQLEQLASKLRTMVGLPAAQGPAGGPTAGDLATATAQSTSDEIAREMDRLNAVQASLDEVNQRAQAQLAAAQAAIASASTPSLAAGTLAFSPSTPRGVPVNGVLTQAFGPTDLAQEPAYGAFAHFHTGIDLAVPTGTLVKATGGGTVIVAGWSGGYGNLVVIDHGNGIQTYYGHNSQLVVTVGQQVNAGTVIALSGSTGNSTGPHVHYEIRVGGVPVDPIPFTKLAP